MLKSQDLKEFRSVLLMLQARIQGDVEQLPVAETTVRRTTSQRWAPMSGKWTSLCGSWKTIRNCFQKSLPHSITLTTEPLAFAKAVWNLVLQLPATIPKSRLNTIPYSRNRIHCERKREQESSS